MCICMYMSREKGIVITVIACVVHSLIRISWVLIVSLQDRYGRTW